MCLNGNNICKSPSTSCIFCCVNFTQRVSSRRQATTTKTGPENGLVKKTCRSQSNKPCSKCLLRNWMFLKHTQTMENNFEFLLKWTVGRYQTNLSQNQKSPLPIPTNIWTMTPVQRRFIHSNFLLSTIWMIFPYDFPVWFSHSIPVGCGFSWSFPAARSSLFDQLTVLVVCVNAVWIVPGTTGRCQLERLVSFYQCDCPFETEGLQW